MKDRPIFTISLDTELVWGLIHTPGTRFKEYVDLLLKDETKCRGAIDFLLGVFEKYNIPATWAICGHLFLDHCQKENGVLHKDMPRFKDGWYDCDPGTDIYRDPLYYGKDIIEKIMSSRIEHEIGYHSFSHIDFSQCSREVAEAEIRKGIELANEFGIPFKSFVFPWNNVGHLDILKKYGFLIYRSPEPRRFDPAQNFVMRRVNGVIDLLLAPSIELTRKQGIWEVAGSMDFWERQYPFMILPRAKLGIRRVIRTGKIFHLTIHPFMMVLCSPLMHKLDKFLAFVSSKRDNGELEVVTMSKLVSLTKDRGYLTHESG